MQGKESLASSSLRCPKCGLQLDHGVPVCPNDGTRVVPEIQVNQVFENKYQLVARIAAGGMGVIFKARQLELGRFVAIKMLMAMHTTPLAVMRFQQEAQTLAKMDHPNLVRVHEMGVSAYGQPYTVMEFIEGEGLDKMIAEQGQIELLKALHIMQQVCEGLAYVHDWGILHRDLKPSNIMLINPRDDEPKVKLVDFGIAKIIDEQASKSLTQTGEVFGSPLYMSPEQARGAVLDARSDIYSLGCVLYEMLTGRPPFAGHSTVELILKKVGEQPKPLNSMSKVKYPNAVESLVQHMLDKEPAERFQSVYDLSQEISQLIKEHRNWYRVSIPFLVQTSRDRMWAWAVGALAIVSIGSLSFALWALSNKPPEQKVDTDHFVNDFPAVTKAMSQGPKSSALSNPDEPMTLTARKLFVEGETAPKTYLKVGAQSNMEREAYDTVTGSDAKYLDIANMRPIRADALIWIKQRPQKYIDDLNAENSSIGDASIKYIADLPVGRLNLGGTDVTAASMPQIAKMDELGTLELNGIRMRPSDILKLKKLSHLTTLDLTHCGLNDDCLKAVAEIKTLRVLYVSENPAITNAGIAHLTQLNLCKLAMEKCSIDDHVTGVLAQMPSLIQVAVGKNNITDAAWTGFAKMPRLLGLSLEKTKITDSGLEKAQMPKLLLLMIGSNDSVTATGVNAFRQNNPRCYPYWAVAMTRRMGQ